MSTNTLPIVGAFYRPPAKALLDAISIGTRLTLIAEPDNPYDPNAIAVYLASADIAPAAHTKLELELPAYGFSLEQILEQEVWHLGYVPKDFAWQLRKAGFAELPVDVTFSVSAGGAPRVRSEEPFPTQR